MACNGGGGFALGLLVGGVIGAAAGLLLAPKPGAETRSEIMEMGETWRTRADSMAADMRSRGMQELSDVGQRVGPAVDSLKARGASVAADARSRIVNSTDGVQAQPVAASPEVDGATNAAPESDGAAPEVDGATPESASAPEPKAPETA